MAGRPLILLGVSALLLKSSWAAPAPLAFDAQWNTWSATHIVVVEDGKVVESWKGNLKPGDALPDGAARFAMIRPPKFVEGSAKPGEPAPSVTGKRMVLFLAFVPRQGWDPKKQIWMGADAAGHHADPVTPATVAWIEGDRVFTVVGVHGRGTYAMRPDGGIAGLRQRVDLGIALRSQFEAARAEKDPARRAERFDALVPIVSKYVGLGGPHDCVVELIRCGVPAAPIFTRWAREVDGEYWDEGLWGLQMLGDVGFDAMLKILEGEVRHWRSVAELKPDAAGPEPLRAGAYPRRPGRLYFVLDHTRHMKLSAANQKRLRDHPGLKELDALLAARPDLSPAKGDMTRAHEALRDIRAGKFEVPE